MKFKYKHFGSFFTFLESLVICAHAVVPHHCHFDISHSSEMELPYETPVQSQNHDKPDMQCHLFNILVSGNTNSTSLIKYLSDNCIFFPDGISVQCEIPPVKYITTPISGNHSIFIKQFLYTAHSLRGPPVMLYLCLS